jgi:hypothetical protein
MSDKPRLRPASELRDTASSYKARLLEKVRNTHYDDHLSRIVAAIEHEAVIGGYHCTALIEINDRSVLGEEGEAILQDTKIKLTHTLREAGYRVEADVERWWLYIHWDKQPCPQCGEEHL